MRALAVIDGEHYPPVVEDALRELPYEFSGALLAGGTEKLGAGAEGYGVPVVDELEEALTRFRPDVVVDLSDEPVLGPRERFWLASRVLAAGLPYVGPDFRLDPPALAPFGLASVGIVGTGKRVGKTALSAHAARLLGADRDVVVVAMGRGGPPEAELIAAPPSADDLLERSRAGLHAASDHLEDAVLAGVVTVGCRRCGGGLAGMPATSNVAAGAALAASRDPDLVLFEGSGAAFPPIETTRRLLVVPASQQPELATGYLNAYRVLVSDLVVLTMAEEGSGWRRVRDAIHDVKRSMPLVPVVLRPRPIEPIVGRRIALFSTAEPAALPRLAAHLAEAHGAEAVHVSGNLGRRDELREDLAEMGEVDAFVTEIKAAAIDVVAEAAAERGVPVVFADTDVVPVAGADLDTELRALADAAISEHRLAA